MIDVTALVPGASAGNQSAGAHLPVLPSRGSGGVVSTEQAILSPFKVIKNVEEGLPA